MRLIDADKFEADLENSCDAERDSHAFVNFLAYLDKQPTINDWILVSDRLPTDYQRLIVYTKQKYLYLSRFRNNEFIDIEYSLFNENQKNIICDVMAWRPLPEPPKELK